MPKTAQEVLRHTQKQAILAGLLLTTEDGCTLESIQHALKGDRWPYAITKEQVAEVMHQYYDENQSLVGDWNLPFAVAFLGNYIVRYFPYDNEMRQFIASLLSSPKALDILLENLPQVDQAYPEENRRLYMMAAQRLQEFLED